METRNQLFDRQIDLYLQPFWSQKVRGRGPRGTDEIKELQLIKHFSNMHDGVDTIVPKKE